ncbi:hypothetical protein Tco_0212628 [Tanacetum coccineum]
MACSLPHTIEEIQAYVQKQCDQNDVTRQAAIFGVITLFEQAKEAKEDLSKQYAECKDIYLERRALLQKFLDGEAWKDYQLIEKLLRNTITCTKDVLVDDTLARHHVSEILDFPNISHVPVSGPKWAPCLARVRSNRVLADVGSLPRMFLGPRKLSVIAAAKVSHFEILCRVHDCEPTVGLFRCFYVNSKNKGWMSFSKRPGHDAVCYTKPLDSLKGWNDHFFWVDAFACPASFSWHTGKSVSKDPFPQSTEFNAEHYASLVAYPAPFHKYPEPFLCLVGMSRYYTLDENTYPEFLYENGEGGCCIMDLLSFVHTADPTKVRIGERQRGEDEPKLLDTIVGRVVSLLPVAPARGESELEDSVDKLFETIREAKSVIVDSDEPSHLAKKLRKDHGISFGTFVAGKSMPAIQQLLAGAVQNAAIKGELVPSFPFVTSSVSTTPEREDEKHTDTLARDNLQTVTAPQRFVISSDSSHHSGTHIVETKADSLIRSSAPAMTTATTITITAGAAVVVKETVAKPSLFATGSSCVGGTEPIPGGFSDLTSNDFLVGDIRTVIDPDSDLQKSDEIRSLKESNAALEKKKGELDVRVVDLAASVKVKEREVVALDIVVATVKLQNGRLIDQDERMKEVKDKFDKLDVDVIEMALHLEERFYPHLLTTIVERRVLSDVAAFNPSAKSNYISALQELQDVKFSLLAELKSNKDANIETLMNILRLEEPVAERLGLQESQPHEDQLMVPILHSPDQTIVGATSLSFSLDVSRNRVQKIRDNIANYRYERYFGTIPETTTVLSVTFAPVSSIPPISYGWNYELHNCGEQCKCLVAGVDPFPNVDDAGSDHFLVTFYNAWTWSFPMSSAWLASLLRYTKSPGLKLVLRTFEL